jgi:hypothetical protein
MEYLTIVLAVVAGLGVITLAWLSGYENGEYSGIQSERQLADRRIAGLLAQENKRKPRIRRNRA